MIMWEEERMATYLHIYIYVDRNSERERMNPDNRTKRLNIL